MSDGLFMASVCCQYYDIDSNTERVEIVMHVLTRPNVDKAVSCFSWYLW